MDFNRHFLPRPIERRIERADPGAVVIGRLAKGQPQDEPLPCRWNKRRPARRGAIQSVDGLRDPRAPV